MSEQLATILLPNCPTQSKIEWHKDDAGCAKVPDFMDNLLLAEMGQNGNYRMSSPVP
jgi:hypothetical protein